MAKKDIRKYSLKELREQRNKKQSKTKPDAKEHEVDASFWDNAEITIPTAKKSVHLRMDEDVLEWFKAQGAGHLTRMHAVLRSYYEAHHTSK